MPSTKRLSEGLKKIISHMIQLSKKRKSRIVVGYINGVTQSASQGDTIV